MSYNLYNVEMNAQYLKEEQARLAKHLRLVAEAEAGQKEQIEKPMRQMRPRVQKKGLLGLLGL